jgi:general secretion pathway protein K
MTKWLNRMRARVRDERGFALVLVLWIAGLLAVLTAGLSVSVRTQVRVAANVIESAKAEALADSGVTLTLMDLLAARRSREHVRRFPVDGRTVACASPDGGRLAISVMDEGGRIDVNTAGIPVMQALLVGLGLPAEKAAQVAEAIFDFRDEDDERKPNGAESADYRAAGLGWSPKNGPLQSVSELGQVYGLTPDLLARMRPYLSTNSGLPGIDPALAQPELIALLRAGLAGVQSAYGSFPELDAAVALPATFISTSLQSAFKVRVASRAPSGAVFIREAIAATGSRQAPAQALLGWTRGLDIQPTEEKELARTQMPNC